MIFSRSAFVLLLAFTVSLCADPEVDGSPDNLPKPDTTVIPLPTTVTPPTEPPKPNTTVAPTTVSPPTEAPTTPVPVDDKSKWVVTGVNNTVCILAKMNITLKVPYNTTDNKPDVRQFELNPYNTNSSGNCSVDNSTQVLIVMRENITVTFVFVANSTAKNYDLGIVNVTLILNNYTLPNATLKENLTLVHTAREFTTPTKMSYTCSNPDPLLMNSTQVTKAQLFLSNVNIEAFGTKQDRNFSEAMDCNTFETPDIVPIAVGCALAALVIVVLISYLVGRRRSQARGYLSM